VKGNDARARASREAAGNDSITCEWQGSAAADR
jgi:hypothetical protein